ncbi:G_PROTEIN_RECEP_F1_2 domain-containing protein [Meloidogyne graminicola]|uniref:G_PROTEIN_RECEP_F1_2 domain-containing protein n=1 Tax=Meloidogyne graminicola TaxID=189291 RepID=A0A8S9ZDV6_9BILA|nr:G_PROTEIN_RECEP_F1_2 domain-containing protein [Meloidogyne graminicola]
MKESKLIKQYYRFMDWFSLLIFNFLPIGLLAYLNIKLMKTLRKIVRRDSSVSSNFLQQNNLENEQQQQIKILPMENKNSEENSKNNLNANAMLFSVVLLLFICIGPQAAARLLYEWNGIYHINSVVYTCISQQLVFLNASLNFCLYCLVSCRYRLMLKETLKQEHCCYLNNNYNNNKEIKRIILNKQKINLKEEEKIEYQLIQINNNIN